jgi:hypothetical protein
LFQDQLASHQQRLVAGNEKDVLLHGRLRLLAASIRAAALILATWMREKPPDSVVQFSPGFDLQKGHARVIGLTGSTSNARLDFGILLFLLSKQPLTSATTQVMTVK